MIILWQPYGTKQASSSRRSGGRCVCQQSVRVCQRRLHDLTSDPLQHNGFERCVNSVYALVTVRSQRMSRGVVVGIDSNHLSLSNPGNDQSHHWVPGSVLCLEEVHRDAPRTLCIQNCSEQGKAEGSSTQTRGRRWSPFGLDRTLRTRSETVLEGPGRALRAVLRLSVPLVRFTHQSAD